jgi:hypothetical protein
MAILQNEAKIIWLACQRLYRKTARTFAAIDEILIL